LLVIDSGKGSFESGFGLGGQTKEHAYLVKSLGVHRLIIAINKMDLIDWDIKRFQEIKDIIDDYLKSSLGFMPEQLE